MPILKIKIDGCCKTLHFTFAEAVPPGEFVLIPSEGGGLLAEVLPESPSVLEHLQDKILPGILKRATVEEVDHFRKKAEREKEAYHFCKERIRIREIPLKLLKVIFFADEKKSIFYFTAEGRVDFRDIVKDLARRYRMRIEMKQIGARQEAGRIGGIGPCGRELCCATWMTSFVSVSTSAARFQDISLNPQKLAGQCAKLKCCMNYEVDSYVEAQKKLPSREIELETKDGTYYFFKADIMANQISYSTDKNFPANLITISGRRAFEIISMNRKGVKPDTLIESERKPEPKKPIDLLEQESLTRFDKRHGSSDNTSNNSQNRKKKKSNNRPQQAQMRNEKENSRVQTQAPNDAQQVKEEQGSHNKPNRNNRDRNGRRNFPRPQERNKKDDQQVKE